MVRAGLAVLLVVPLAAVGQAPPPAAPPAGQPAAPQPQQRQMDPQLWQHLLNWEGVMKGASNFVSEKGTKVQTDPATRSEKQFEATIWCLKPNLARMRLDRIPPAGQRPDPADFETYICTGRAVYAYDGRERTVTEYPLGPAGGVGDNLLLEFMSGSITARQAAQRFAITWVNQDSPHYITLELVPLLPNDQKEFAKLTLALFKPGLPAPHNRLAYLPAMARLVKPNNQEYETWSFPAPMINAAKGDQKPIVPADFQYVPPDKGWTVRRAGQNPPAMPPAGPRAPRVGGP